MPIRTSFESGERSGGSKELIEAESVEGLYWISARTEGDEVDGVMDSM